MARKQREAKTQRDGTGRALFCAALVAALVAAAGALWWQRVNAVPVIVLPAPRLPNPNAYDFYVRAGGLVAPGDYLLSAEEQRKRRGGRLVSLGETRKGLRQSAGAVPTLRAGFAFAFQEPFPDPLVPRQPDITTFPNLAGLLRAEGRLRAASGDHAGATDSYLDAMRLGEDVPRGNGGVIGLLVGVLCAKFGREQAWHEVDFLDARAARRAARRLEAINARRFPWADTLIGERRAILSLVQQTTAQQNIFESGNDVALAAGGGPVQKARVATRIWLKGKRSILTDYLAYTDQIIANARRPFALRPPDPPRPSDPVAALFIPPVDLKTVSLNVLRRDTGNALLLAALGLRAYRVEHGRYPARLDELVRGGYLSRVPDDPCALPGVPLRYRPLPGGQKYLLYSVGADGKDDNGAPVNIPKSRRQKNPAWMENNKGDFVAGVNAD